MDWQEVYSSLTHFIAAHREIRIDESRVSIPDTVRGEFYRLFDAVRDAFVQEHYPALPVEAAALVEEYLRMEREVTRLLGVEHVLMPTAIDLFLHNPQQSLASALFDGLFDLLKGKVDGATFERQASPQLEAALADLCRWGYPYWVALAVVSLLEPEAAFQVGLDSEAKPLLKVLTNIPFGCPPRHPTRRWPEFLVHSRRIGRYVAVKLELASEIGTYTTDDRAERKQAIRNGGQTLSGLGPRTLLLYVLARKENIPMVADLDTRQVFPPDTVVECQETASWDEPRLRKNILRPKRGAYIARREPVEETDLRSPDQDLRPLPVGLDLTHLQPVIEALARQGLDS